MNNERSATELSMFALVAGGIWISIWSIILSCGGLSALGLLMIFSGIIVLAFCND